MFVFPIHYTLPTLLPIILSPPLESTAASAVTLLVFQHYPYYVFLLLLKVKYVKREVRELLDEDWNTFLDALAIL